MESSRLVRVFVSSPAAALQKEREVVLDSLRRIDGCHPVAMESFGARAEEPIVASLAQLQGCQAFVAFFGDTYGSGVTKLEYEEARRLNLPCFVFFRHPDSLPANWEEREPMLAALKGSPGFVYDTFTTAENLAGKIATAIGNWLRQPGSVPPELAVHIEELKNYLSHELAREQADPLGLTFDPDLPPLSGMEEVLAIPIQEHLDGSPGRTLRDLLDNQSINRFVLVGEPGTGKTSLLKQIAL